MRAEISKSQPPCHLCGNPIDYTLPHTDPMSFVVDHVVPLNAGGSDALDNGAAAHKTCNRAKGDRAYGPQLRRSGSLT